MVMLDFSSRTRGLWAGGITPAVIDTIEYVTITSTGNSIDFGNLVESRYYPAAVSNSTRGLVAGGFGNPS